MTEAISITVQHCYVYDLQNMCVCTCHTSAYMEVKACVFYGVKSIMAPRDETILQYIDILQYLLLQYNTIQYGLKEISIYCTLQYIVLYCNILQCLLS